MTKYRTLIHGPKPKLFSAIDDRTRLATAVSLEEAAHMFNDLDVDWSLIGSLGLSMYHHNSLNKDNMKKINAKLKKIAKDEFVIIDEKPNDESLESIIGYSNSDFSLIRIPSNINIELNRKDLQKFMDGMKEFKYKLYENITSVSYPKTSSLYVAFYRELSKNIQTNKIFNRPLLLESTNPEVKNNPLLKHIDVRICHKKEDGSTTIYHNGKPIQIKKPYLGRTITLGDQKIKLRNLDYLHYIKSNSKNPADIYDLRFVSATTLNISDPKKDYNWDNYGKKIKVGDKNL